MSHHPALPTKTSLTSSVLSLLFFLCIFITSNAETPPADSSSQRFFVGYERGLSFRYFPVRNWGIGLLATTSNRRALYANEYGEHGYESDENTQINTSRTKNRNISLHLELMRNVKRKGPFTLAAFVSAGGSYSTYKRNTTNFYEHIFSDDSTYVSNQSFSSEETQWGIIGRIGILPGFTWGAFSAQFRFGLEGRYLITDIPGDSKRDSEVREDINERKTTELNFIRPVNLVESLILHLEI